jgi:signal transduction histidine kinase
MEPLLKATGLCLNLGPLPAVRDVSLEIYPGQVVGLAGRSGAGKSALAMLLAGVHVPTQGQLHFAGRPVGWPFDARALGIEVIYQQPAIAENLSIAHNVFLGHEIGWPGRGKWLKVPDRARMEREAARILARLGMSVASLREPAAALSGEQRQLVAIARAMTRPARLIIVDDPMLLLSYPSQQRLLSLIQSWQREQTAVLFASGNVDHLLAVTDRILVLRDGQCVADLQTDGTGREEILAAMVGIADRQQLTPIMWALDSYYRAREQAEKLSQRQALLDRELDARAAAHWQVLDHMADQIDTLDTANAALQDAQRRLLAELEEERKQLAREIHDQVIQDLLAVSYELEEIGARDGTATSLQSELLGIRGSIRDLVDDLRHICRNLRPPTLDSLGLGPALESYTREWAEHSGIAVKLSLDARLKRLPESIELSIFRIVQEALNNVRKHAAATVVEITLQHTSPRTLMLSIADNGCGLGQDFDLAALPTQGHYGLLGISERVALLGGRFKVQNHAPGGTLLQVEIPHPRIEAPGDQG